MKTCLICHAECADDATSCAACGEGSFAETAPTDAETAAAADSATEPSADARPSKRSKR